LIFIEAYIEVLMLSVADKLHNARCILADYREIGEELWSRFNTGKEGTLWYYRELIKAYRKSENIPKRNSEKEKLCILRSDLNFRKAWRHARRKRAF
jgi:(p)ppGpp synthase/HD superfamily hydrolase